MTRQGETGRDIADKTVLITGANRGIGRALVDEALLRGVRLSARRARLS
jgi:NAD(P)-dependent dehydrogenase (short-subunit alcohol dehydrogenase family)